MRIKFSIVTIVLNDPLGLEDTMKSVLIQSYKNYEHIIVDGCSTDCTLKIAKSNATPFTKIYSEKDDGIYQAMNKGIKYCTGDFLIFMNAGDTFYNRNVLKNISLKIIDRNVIYVGKYFNKTKDEIGKTPGEKLLFKTELPFNHQAVVNPVTIFKQKEFPEDFKILGDLKFYKSIYEENCISFNHIDLIISNYDFNGLSSIPSCKYLREVEKINGSDYNWDFNILYFRLKYNLKILGYKIFKIKI